MVVLKGSSLKRAIKEVEKAEDDARHVALRCTEHLIPAPSVIFEVEPLDVRNNVHSPISHAIMFE